MSSSRLSQRVWRAIRCQARRVDTTERSWWFATFALVALIGSAWALASPPTAPPDEAAHAITAVAVAHGDLLGSPISPAQRRALELGRGGQVVTGRVSAYRSVSAPKIYSEGTTACFAFRREVSAACLRFDGSRANTAIVTPTMWYPPVFYAWVGLLSMPFAAGPAALYAMRLASVGLAAALIASSAASLRRTRFPQLALSGLLVALTPTCLFFAASVNPSGLEIVAGIAMWSSGTVLVDEAATVVAPRLVARFGVATALLILARHPGPLWAGLIAIVLLARATPLARRKLLGARSFRWGASGLGVCFAAQLAWIAEDVPTVVDFR
jgi:Predicted membrane protein (DUF2142)